MNLLKIFPERIKQNYERSVLAAGGQDASRVFLRNFVLSMIFSIVISAALFFVKRTSGIVLAVIFASIFIFFQVIFYFYFSLKAGARVKRIESVFPDFIQMMASNLRAGMTVEKSFMLSARPEFAPLDEEISRTTRDIATGRNMISAFEGMGKRINSDKINKTIYLISSGLKAGGNMSMLLEQTANNMREKEFLEKRAASNVLTYVILILFAVGIGAPILFSLSSILIEVIMKISLSVPSDGAMKNSLVNIPITFSNIGISPEFVIYFSLVFLAFMDIISSLLIGLINKGQEKEGLKYILPLTAVSISLFFIVRFILRGFISESLLSVT